MGCCVSKGAQEVFIDVPRTVSTTDEWVLRQKSFLEGCKLLPYTAACPASYPYQCLTRVVLGDGHLFAALWEGKGGAQAARHCVSACYDVVLGMMQAGEEPSTALEKAFQQLDESYLASDLPDVVKAGVGATGTMLLLDTRSNRCHIARLGKSMPFATATKGAFNTVAVEVQDLLPFSNNVRSRSSSHVGAESPSSSSQQQEQRQWDPATAGVTHAVGIGCGKRDDLRKAWAQHQQQQQQASGADAAGPRRGKPQRVPRVSTECEVYVSQLSPQDENIVIAAEGLIQASPPKEIATLLQHFSAGTLIETKRALCAITEQQAELRQQQQEGQAAAGKRRPVKGQPAAAAGADPLLTQLSTPTNVASIVVHQALAKSLDRFNAAFNQPQQPHEQQEQESGAAAEARQGRQQPGAAYQVPDTPPPELTYAELLHLPLHVDLGAFAAGKSQPEQVVRLPDYYPVGGLSKADVHGDMGVIVIALNWPRPPDAIRAAAHHVTPLRPGPRALTRRPGAEWRWMLLRLHVKARQAYKRSLRKAWWQLVEDVQLAAEAAARQAEVHAWKTKGAAVKVSLGGAVVDPDTPVSHLREHPTPPTASLRQSHRQPTASPASRPGSSSNQSYLTPTRGHSSSGSALPGASSALSSGGGGYYGGGAGLVAQERSLPDVGVRSVRSGGGVRGGGVVAAAVAEINSRSPQKGEAAYNSPPYAGSTGSSGYNKASSGAGMAHGRRGGGLSVPAVQTAFAGGQDTAQDLDSPSKQSLQESPSSRDLYGYWVSPPISASKAQQSSRIPAYGSHTPAGASGGSSSGGGSAHKSLSLRSRGGGGGGASAAWAASSSLTTAVSTPPDRAGRQSGTPPGAYVASAGVTGRRGGGASSGGGASVSLRPGGGTPGSATRGEIGLRKTPAGVRR